MSFAILRHALLMVWDNRVVAFRIALPLIVFMVFLNYVFLSLTPQVPNQTDGLPEADMIEALTPSTGGITAQLALVLAQVIVSAWVVVRWHRYVLMPEAGHAPTPPIDRVLAYVLVMIQIALLLVFSVMLVALASSILGALGAALMFVLVLVIYTFAVRLSIALPAAAIGAPLGLRRALAVTEGHSMVIFGVIVLALLISLVLLLPVLGLTIILPAILHPMLNGVLSGMYAIITGSILTTLYGVYVEKRRLR